MPDDPQADSIRAALLRIRATQARRLVETVDDDADRRKLGAYADFLDALANNLAATTPGKSPKA